MVALPKQPNKSLIDGIRCLQEVLSRSEPVGVAQVAAELGLETTRVHRILRTLAASGMLRWTEKRKYAPGPAVPVLATQTMHASGFYKAIEPMAALHSDLNMITAMGLLWNRSVSYLYHAHPNQPLTSAISSLDVWPATVSGLGVALLALLPNEAVEELYVDREIPKFDSTKHLLEKLSEVRERGYALHDNTLAISIETNFLAAVGFSSPKVSPKTVSKYLPRLLQCKEEILSKLDSVEA
ncbi:IclR family transcriptional regulator domain-containing protein [Rubellicoccus peritrichatus]|uniref:Helix-turn-helix domain-containing protein n=1 Tax=Rubellicoccus peritrichatus TaxID=3080537 RepID=A0AAQ3LFN8_9BACT|nr:helix-turn-helix domain-containing protein [Puniceicoccus sp. CR14]WOO43704.1 helix-turn-helix domain-containing protein [Puniceicoccus sp. CR14]